MSELVKEPVLKTGDAERHCGFESYHHRQFANVVELADTPDLDSGSKE